MQLLATANVYDHEADEISGHVLLLLQNAPEGFMIVEGNAGLGADWPAVVWRSAQALSVMLAVFSAPATIKDNWELWREIYDRAVAMMLEFHGGYCIDRGSAQMIAMHHAVFVDALDSDRLTVNMAVRHYFTSTWSCEDLLNTPRINMSWPGGSSLGEEGFLQSVRSTEEAAKQANSRYLFGLDDGRTGLTVVVEKDGSVSYSRRL